MSTNLRRWLFAAAVLATTVFGSAASAAPILIDNLNVPAGGQATTFGTPRTGAFPSTILGANGVGTRTISYAGAGNFSGAEGVFVNSPSATMMGTLEMGTVGGAVATSATYTAFPQNLDLSQAGNFFDLDFHLVDNGASIPAFAVTIEATTASGNLTKTFNIADIPFNLTATTLSFGIDNTWTGPGTFANVSGLKFTLNSGQLNAADFILGEIRTRDGAFRRPENVPEPASLAVFGLLTLAGGAFARRRGARKSSSVVGG
jgi:hypothetical protein